MKKIPFYILILVTALLAVTTAFERPLGTQISHEAVYDAPWFWALWGLLAGGVIYRLKDVRKFGISTLIGHIGMVVILAAALVTALTSQRGRLHLRIGESADMFLVSHNHVEHLPFEVTLDDFDVEFYGDSITPKNYVSYLSTDSVEVISKMNQPAKIGRYRFLQTGCDDDGFGSTLQVNYDPWGTPLTYVGYALLAIALLLRAFSWKGVLALAAALGLMCVPEVGGGSEMPFEIPEWTGLAICGAGLILLTIFKKRYIHYLLLVPFVAMYVLRWYYGGHMPLGNSYDTLQFLTIGLLAAPGGIASVALATCAQLVAYMSVFSSQMSPLAPVLASPLLCLHVTVVMFAYVLLAYLLVKPSRKVLKKAVALLATGIVIGAVWANVSWGNYWHWDPKEVWALITMFIYCLPLHAASLPVFRKKKVFDLYCRLAFIAVLFTYFGVNLVLGGFHSYFK